VKLLKYKENVKPNRTSNQQNHKETARNRVPGRCDLSMLLPKPQRIRVLEATTLERFGSDNNRRERFIKYEIIE
jgi:hypothetical protein